MKKRIVILLAGLLLLIAGCGKKTGSDAASGENTKPTKNEAAGEAILASFSTKTLDGEKVTEEVLKGFKVTMINVWGTYCSPCIREMPELGKLAEKYKDRGLQIIGLPIDVTDRGLNPAASQITKAKGIIADTGANYLHILPSVDLMNAFLFNAQSIPYTIFVNEKGEVLGDPCIGARSMEQWESVIKGLLEG